MFLKTFRKTITKFRHLMEDNIELFVNTLDDTAMNDTKVPDFEQKYTAPVYSI